MDQAITIRHATERDQEALYRLAQLDSGRVPSGDALLGFVDGELRAALPLDGGRPLADPFHRSGPVLDLLAMRANGRSGAPVRARRRLTLLRGEEARA